MLLMHTLPCNILLWSQGINELDILSCDMQNAHLSAPFREKIYCRAGPEFRSEVGKVMIMKIALHRLKSSSTAFRSTLAQVIYDIACQPSKADSDACLKPVIKANGF